MLPRKKHTKKIVLLIDQMINSGGNFLITLLLARLLGLDGFGYYSIALIIGMFSVGVSQAIIIFPAQTIAPKLSSQSMYSYCRSTIYLAILLAILSGGSVFVASYFFKLEAVAELSTIDRYAITSTVIGLQLHIWARRMSYVIKNGFAALLGSLIRYIVQGFFVMSLFFIDQQDEFFFDIPFFFTIPQNNVAMQIIGLGIGSFSGAIVSTIIWWVNDNNKYPVTKLFKEHWRLGKWLIGTTIFNWFGSNLIIIIAGTLLGVAAIGALRAAQNIIGVASIIVQVMENVVPVSAAQHYARNNINNLFTYILSISTPVLLIGITACIIITYFSSEIMQYTYGSDYKMFGDVLSLLAFNFIFGLAAFFIKIFLRAVEMMKPLLYSQIVITIFVLFSSKFIVKEYGVIGAASGLMAAQLIGLTLLSCYAYTFYRKNINRVL